MHAIDALSALLPARIQKAGVVASRLFSLRLAAGSAVRYAYFAPDPAYRAAVVADTSPQFRYPAADWLGPHLDVVQSATLVAIEKTPLEDVLLLRLSNGMSFAIHYFGKQGNVVLIDQDGMVAAVWHPIDKHIVGSHYVRSADARGTESCIRELPVDDLLAVVRDAELQDVRRDVLRRLNAARARLETRLEKIADDEQEAARAVHYRLCGELLKVYYHLLKRGMSQVTVHDILTDGGGDVTIPLKPDKTPQENIAAYFHKAKKGERAPDAIAKRRALTEQEIAALDEQCRTAASLADVDVLRALMAPAAPVRREKTPEERQADRIRRFISSDGIPILAGRNAKDNDYLTTRVAKGNDLWLHTHNRPGAHVVVRVERGQEIPRTTLAEAAQVCVHLSKVADGDLEDVMYTHRKHVSKPRGAKPGSVLVAAGKTIRVRQRTKLMEQWLRDHDARTARADI